MENKERVFKGWPWLPILSKRLNTFPMYLRLEITYLKYDGWGLMMKQSQKFQIQVVDRFTTIASVHSKSLRQGLKDLRIKLLRRTDEKFREAYDRMNQ